MCDANHCGIDSTVKNSCQSITHCRSRREVTTALSYAHDARCRAPQHQAREHHAVGRRCDTCRLWDSAPGAGGMLYLAACSIWRHPLSCSKGIRNSECTFHVLIRLLASCAVGLPVVQVNTESEFPTEITFNPGEKVIRRHWLSRSRLALHAAVQRATWSRHPLALRQGAEASGSAYWRIQIADCSRRRGPAVSADQDSVATTIPLPLTPFPLGEGSGERRILACAC